MNPASRNVFRKSFDTTTECSSFSTDVSAPTCHSQYWLIITNPGMITARITNTTVHLRLPFNFVSNTPHHL